MHCQINPDTRASKAVPRLPHDNEDRNEESDMIDSDERRPRQCLFVTLFAFP